MRALILLLVLSVSVPVGSVRTARSGIDGAAVQTGPEDISELLEPFRAEGGLPALAAAVIQEGELRAIGAVGVRKFGEPVKVTTGDCFHLGSCTKAMTATVTAILVEEGALRWDSTIGEVLTDLKEVMHPDYRGVTLHQLLRHRGGCPSETGPKGVSFMALHSLPGDTMVEQRLKYVEMILKEAPEEEPGTRYIYSNAGYVIAGAMMEAVSGRSWEELMKEKLFEPLGITTAGFGAMGTPGEIDQPRQHRSGRRDPIPIEPGPRSDNPLVIGPAGTVHMSLQDWGRFVAAHLDGRAGMNDLLRQETWEFLHRPPADGNYACGWGVVNREWAGGEALTHAGSNTVNFALVWTSVARRFAVLVVTNIVTEATPGICDRVAAALIQKYPD